MDLYSRKIIEWTLSETLEAVHVAETVRKTMKKRKITAPLVLHSDRGSQYVSDAYRQAAAGLQLSYSKKGYPYDNACIESFHSLIKREWLNRFRIKDFQQAYKLVFEYIDAFTTRFAFTVTAISFRLSTLKICTKIRLFLRSLLSVDTIWSV